MDDEIVELVIRFVHDLRMLSQRHPKYVMYGQGKIIRLLDQHPGVSQRELAELAALKPASLTETIERMERDGLVERQRDQRDHRIIRVKLTPLGQKRSQQLAKEHQQFQKALLNSLSVEEKQALIQICQKLNTNLQALIERGIQK